MDVEILQPSYTTKGEMVQLLWKIIGQLLKRLNVELPYDPTILLLGICLREIKTYIHMTICIQMLTEALLITAKEWKQLKYPVHDEWINKT